MTLPQAIVIAKDFADYRRGKGHYVDDHDSDGPCTPPLHSPAQYGEALDVLIAWAEATETSQ